MKKVAFFFLAAAFMFSSGCSQTVGDQPATKGPAAVIKFEKAEHDFGTIEYAAAAEYSFVFTNAGDAPLAIQDVAASCGCTVPEWSKEPLKKGESASIKVKYNSRISGSFNKSITVYSNSEGGPIVLRIKGTVQPQQNQNQ